MRNKNYLLTWIIFLISILFFGLISAQPVVDDDVEITLKNSTWIQVSISLVDLGGKDTNIMAQSEIISNFTEDEFELSWKSSNGRGFMGNITKKGLEKLKENQNVLRVYLPIGGSTTEIICGDDICDAEENCENCIFDCGCLEQEECIEGKCELKEIDVQKDFTWIWITISSIIFLVIVIYLLKRKK